MAHGSHQTHPTVSLVGMMLLLGWSPVLASVNKRSDDTSLQALSVEVGRLAEQMTSLTAQVTALTTQLTSQQNDLTALKATVDRREQTVAFFANGAAGSINAAPRGVVMVTHLLTNVGNSYDTLTGFFTAPVSGLYQFTATFMTYEASQYAHAGIYVGTAQVAYSMADSRHGYRDNVATRALVHVAAGQKVHLMNEESRAVQFYGGPYLTFSGFLVRAD